MTMAADCEQTRARMLELLYGELAPDARAEVEAHVAGCAGCKAELAALQSTRALVRGPLTADAPPARARVAILQAAAAAVPARAAAPTAVPTPAGPSFWARIRAKWTLPTFATVGALAVFLLASRIFMEPEKTYQRGRQGLAPAPAEAPASPPPPAAAEDRKEAAERVRASSTAEAEPSEAPAPSAGVARAHAAHKKAAPASSGASGGKREQPLDDLLDGAARPAARRDFAPEPKRPAKHEISDSSNDDLLEGFAERPMAKERLTAPSAGGAGLASKPAAEPAPARAAAPAPAAAAAPRGAEMMDEDEAAPAPPRVRESAEQRADRLFGQRRWVEAAQAYRELLRDQARSPNVERWRKRLADCNAALLKDR